MKLSVTIITLNEETNIQRAIKSVLFADEIIVVDSGSTDKTRTMALELGAKVFLHPFQGFGQQKNHAASLCRNEWILNLDADEEVSEELKNSLQDLQPREESGIYRMPRLTFFCGEPIFHGGWYPDFKARLYHRGRAEWTKPNVHEDLRPLLPCSSQALQGPLYHYSFPTVKSQVLTNVRYAELGARDLILRKGRKPYIGEMILRPFLKFVECYILKMGFLDGLPGLIIAINASHSMFMKYSFAYFMDEENG